MSFTVAACDVILYVPIVVWMAALVVGAIGPVPKIQAGKAHHPMKCGCLLNPGS
jgi:hypothetical protein